MMFYGIITTADAPESSSSLLMSPLAENNGGACALRQSVKKYNKHSFNKDVKFTECVVLSSHVLTLKHYQDHLRTFSGKPAHFSLPGLSAGRREKKV